MFKNFLKWGWKAFSKKQISVAQRRIPNDTRSFKPLAQSQMVNARNNQSSALTLALNSVPGSRSWAIHAVIVEQTLIHHSSQGLDRIPVDVLMLATQEMSILSRIESRIDLHQLCARIHKVIDMAAPDTLHVELDVSDSTNSNERIESNHINNETGPDKHNQQPQVDDDGFPDTESFPYQDYPKASPPADHGPLFDALEKNNSWRNFH